jgi:hypothetical protein
MDLPFREQVFTGNWVDAELVNNLLTVEGIQTIVAAAKALDPTRFERNLRSVYVLDPDRVEQARAIVAAVRKGETLRDPKTYRSWRCRHCDELVEGQFDVCWKCGRPRVT